MMHVLKLVDGRRKRNAEWKSKSVGI